jgi:hypothetical protein
VVRSSIDVIEEVLGDSLFPTGWKARSYAEIDLSDPAYRVPEVSLGQYREIQVRLQAHWADTIRTMRGDRGTLLVCSRMLTPVHQYLALLDLDPVDRLDRSERAWRILVKPQINLDEAVIARKALLYSDGVMLRDPAQLLRPSRHVTFGDEPDGDLWRELWLSAICQLGLVHKLVRAGIVSLYPASTIVGEAFLNRSDKFARREERQVAELRSLYRADRWTSILQDLPFEDPETAGIYAGWALGQFAWRNITLPGATPWIPNAQCLAALTGVERALNGRILGPDSLTVARLSSRVSIDIGKVSDDDMIAMRSNEELFATWRRLVAELCMELDRLGIDSAADVATLVSAKSELWRSELDRHAGRGGVLSGLFDANPIVCGVITGVAALASGVPPALTAASALGGGLVTPLMRLFANLTGAPGAKRRKRAVNAHFMALEG